MSYRCATCNELHDELPDVGADKPDHWWDVAEEERKSQIELTSDTCIIDDEHFFIRGVIQIPIINTNDLFGFGVWVSQKRENFYSYIEHFDSDEIGPFFGWLCTQIAYYPTNSINLKTSVHFRGGNQRPTIALHSEEQHPLAVDQREGITLDKAWEIVHFFSPPQQ